MVPSEEEQLHVEVLDKVLNKLVQKVITKEEENNSKVVNEEVFE